jgi:hypothetical protein
MGNVRNIGRANLAKMGVNAWAGLLIKRERRDNSRFVARQIFQASAFPYRRL